MSRNRLTKNLPFLRKLRCCKAGQRKKLISKATPDQVKTIADCAHNILIKNIPLSNSQFNQLKRHKHVVRQIGTKGVSLKKKKKLMSQRGGAILSILAPILASVASSLIGGLLNR